MYAEDNRDTVVPNGSSPADAGHETLTWVKGRMVWDLTPDSTNTTLLTDPAIAPLAPYAARSAKIFKCPSDTIPGSLHGGGGTLHFADGHVESKKWSPETAVPVTYGGHPPVRDRRDYTWLWGLNPRAPF